MSCLSLETLERLARGPTSLDGAEGDHVEQCAACRERLDEVRSNLAEESALSAEEVGQTAAERRGRRAVNDAAHEKTVARSTPRAAASPGAPSIAGYAITRELNRGGQGVVYQAIQLSTKRKVAIKVLRDGHFADPREKARFEREVQILGQLKHPHIVTIYDSGSAAGGAFYVMDYIAGSPLDEHVDERRLTLAQTLELFEKICQAVHAAHLRGIIHRDLKPSNIRVDGNGEPHVLDFGLAKVSAAFENTVTPAMTMTDQFLGSLPWCSPEQAEGRPERIDIRTDVYSLGMILYRLLTGTFPFDAVGSLRDVLDRIQHAEPLRPSVALRRRNADPHAGHVPAGRPAEGRGVEPRPSRWASIDDELETIVMRCLSKERERRYQSAGELGRDVQNYLRGDPIEAKRDSALYLLRKQLRRYRWPVLAAASFVLLLAIASVTSTALYIRAENAVAAEKKATAAEKQQREAAEAARQDAQQQARRAEAEKRNAEEAARRAEQRFAEAQLSGQGLQVLLRAKGDLVAAEPHFRHKAEDTIRERGEDHPHAATAMHNYAGILYALGRLDEAEALLRKASETRKRVLPPGEPIRTQSQTWLAELLYERGNWSEAESVFREALQEGAAADPQSESRLAAELGLGKTLTSLGAWKEAETRLFQVYDAVDPDSPMEGEEPPHPPLADPPTGGERRHPPLGPGRGPDPGPPDTDQGRGPPPHRPGGAGRPPHGPPPSLQFLEPTMEALVALYDAWGKAGTCAECETEARAWREKLAEHRAMRQRNEQERLGRAPP